MNFYGDNLVFQTGNNFGSDVGTDSAFGSSVSNGLINEGRIGIRRRRSGHVGC